MNWIRCSDKLPNSYDRVLISMEDPSWMPIKIAYCSFNDSSNPEPEWIEDYPKIIPIPEGWVTHWMPLPDKPKD